MNFIKFLTVMVFFNLIFGIGLSTIQSNLDNKLDGDYYSNINNNFSQGHFTTLNSTALGSTSDTQGVGYWDVAVTWVSDVFLFINLAFIQTDGVAEMSSKYSAYPTTIYLLGVIGVIMTLLNIIIIVLGFRFFKNKQG